MAGSSEEGKRAVTRWSRQRNARRREDGGDRKQSKTRRAANETFSRKTSPKESTGSRGGSVVFEEMHAARGFPSRAVSPLVESPAPLGPATRRMAVRDPPARLVPDGDAAL